MHIFSESAKISKWADIETSNRGTKVIVGDYCMIDSFVKIKFAGGDGDVELGKNCYLNSGTVIYNGNGVKLGNDVLIAANCTIIGASHAYRKKDLTIYNQRFMPSKGGVIIGNDVWLGSNVVVLEGSIIEDGVIVAAGSVVRGHLKAYNIYGGSPLKIIGNRE